MIYEFVLRAYSIVINVIYNFTELRHFRYVFNTQNLINVGRT